jgi:Protein of unknown function (DUF433)
MPQIVRTEHPHIVKIPGVLGGKPVIAGTRIGVHMIARLLRARNLSIGLRHQGEQFSEAPPVSLRPSLAG